MSRKPKEIIKHVAQGRNVSPDQPLSWDEIEHCMRIFAIERLEDNEESSRNYLTIDELWKLPVITHDDLEANMNLVAEKMDFSKDFKTCCTAAAPVYHKSEHWNSIYHCANCKQVVLQINPNEQTGTQTPYMVYSEPTKDKPLLPIKDFLDFKNFCTAWMHLASQEGEEEVQPFQNIFQAISMYITQLRKNQK